MSEILFSKFDEETGQQIVFDPSSLSSAEKCLYYYKVKEIDRHRSRGTLWRALFGQLVHECIEVYHLVKIESGHDVAAKEALRRAIQLSPQLVDSPLTNRTPDTFMRAVAWYTIQWGEEDPFETAIINGQPALELRFEVPIPDTDWRLSGRIDRLATWRDQLFIVDIKTTDRVLNAQYWASWNPSTQFAAYVWAASHMGLNTKSVLIEGCQSMVGGTRWGRHKFDLAELHIKEFGEDLFRLVNDINACWVHDHWPRRRTSCTMYGGCELREICASSGFVREALLKERFEVVPYESPEIKGVIDA